ncbi:MAG: autotransporter domain-containing protein [Rhizobiaceae bacterium]
MALTALAATPAAAQFDLSWDPVNRVDGVASGGSGDWETSEQGANNWFNLSTGTNRQWSDGSNATFTGTPGTVNVTAAAGAEARSLTFTVGGYVFTGTGIELAGAGAGARTVTAQAGTTTFNTGIVGTGITFTGPGEVIIGTGSNNFAATTTLNGGIVLTAADQNAFNGPGTFEIDGGTLRTNVDLAVSRDIDVLSATLAAAAGRTLTVAGNLQLSAGSALTFGSSTDSGTVILTGGFAPASTDHTFVVAGGSLIDQSAGGSFGGTLFFASQSLVVASGATLDFSGNAAATARNLTGGGRIIIAADSGPPAFQLAVNEGETHEFSGVISGAGSVAIAAMPFGPLTGDGTVIFSGNNTYAGDTTICDCTVLQLGNGGASGSVAGNILNGGTLIFNRSDASTYAGVISDDGGLVGKLIKNGSGRITLTGANTYTGSTTVNSGVLEIGAGGSIVSDTTVNGGGLVVNGTSRSVTVNGGFLGGSGAVDSVTLHGGALAPGNSIGTLTVNGTLTFGAGSAYTVEVSPNAADRIDVVGVPGTADLSGGAVRAVFGAGAYSNRRYTILTTTGGLGGTTFTGVTDNAPGVLTSLVHDASNVYLDIQIVLASIPGLTDNQRAVAQNIDAYLAANGTIPGAFITLDPDGLTLAGGQTSTASVSAGLDAMSLYLAQLGDPFVNGAGASGAAGDAYQAYAPLAYSAAPANLSSPGALAALGADMPAASDAANAVLAMSSAHATDPVDAAFAARWKAWGAIYGGVAEARGETIVIGSSDLTTRGWGVASGLHRRFGDGGLGFSLGGAGSTFTLGSGLGSGQAGIFNAGLYGSHAFGNAYVSGALAYAWNSVSTSRVMAGDTLSASFNAHTLGGRIEAGYRLATSIATVTPYAAAQGATYMLPGYAEKSAIGGPFALTYGRQAESALRTELGARFEHTLPMQEGALKLSGRVAWAHNAVAARAVTAAFQALPGQSFTVNGARPDRNAALLDLGIEAAFSSGLSAKLSFNGEFSRNVSAYGASAKISFRW